MGQHVSKILDSYCNSSVEHLSKVSFEELENIDGIGSIVAQSIIDFFQNNNNNMIVKDCFTKGVLIKKTIFNDS